MKTTLTLGVVLLLAGCNKNADFHDSFRELLKAMNQLADTFQKAPNVQDARPNIEALVSQIEVLKKRAESIPVEIRTKNPLTPQLMQEKLDTEKRLEEGLRTLSTKDPMGIQQIVEILGRLK